MSIMYSTKSYLLTKEEYNYLLPAIRNKLSYSNDNHYFVGVIEELEDMLNRLKGLYDFYDEIKSMTIYNCSKYGNLTPFRNDIISTPCNQ